MNYHNFIDCLNVVAGHAIGGYERQVELNSRGNAIYLCLAEQIEEDSITSRRLKELGATVVRGEWVIEVPKQY